MITPNPSKYVKAMSHYDLGLFIGAQLQAIEEVKDSAEAHYLLGLASSELWLRIDRLVYGIERKDQ